MAIFRHVASGTYPGESWSFTLHTEGTIALTAAQAAWASAIGTLWTGALDGLVNENVVLTEVSTASLDPVTGGQISRLSDDVSLPGDQETGVLPPQVSVVVSLRTALATRAGRGRIYLPPFDVVTVAPTTGRVGSTSVATVVSSVEGFLGSLVDDDLTPVIYSRANRSGQNITRFDVGNVFDTQRRRRDKLIEVRTQGTIT